MHFHTSHPLQPFWNVAAAPIQIQALEQALALNLFDRLRQAENAESVATHFAFNPAVVAIWLELLWSMELLSRRTLADAQKTVLYTTSPIALRYFVKDSETCCAQAWQYRAQFLTHFAGQWNTLLRKGFEPQAEGAPKGSWAQAAREQIGQEQRVITVPAVLSLLDTLPALPVTGRLLDLGGGPGHVGIALAKQLPEWRGVICDQPTVVDVAQENILTAGLSDRCQVLGCDLNTDSIGTGYDLIWCSAVLHFLHDPQALIRKIYRALNPGGLLLMAHAEQLDHPVLAAQVLPFYGAVALRGHPLLRQGELIQMMSEANFSHLQSLGQIDFPMTPVSLHAGRKPYEI